MGFYRYTHAVFGCMQDKDIAGVMAKLKDKVDHWYLTALPLARAASTEQLESAALSAGVMQSIEPQHDRSVKSFTSPAEAFHTALSAAGEDDRIVVFGSFFTVAGVMEVRNTAFH